MKSTYRQSPLTAERLREVLRYDPETGVFVWLKRTSEKSRIKVGAVAGHEHKSSGYIVIWVDGLAYQAQVLAWLYVYGEWPEDLVDHRDKNKKRNAIGNLRDANNSQNKANGATYSKPTGLLKGVTINSGRYRAQIVKDYKHEHLGYFDTEELAHAAYLARAKELHGDFAAAD
jgi:hypothetical protein